MSKSFFKKHQPEIAAMKPVRLAVVGAGKLGGYHANIASKADEFDLVAVVDPIESSRNALAEKTGANPVAELESVIEQIDAAVVATPTLIHYDSVMKLLKAGKHVLVEKPIAPNVQQANEMVSAAEDAEVILQVGHVERFNPALEALPEPIVAPKFIQATRTSGFTFRSTDIGAVLDLMIHDIDLTLAIARSEVVDVQAMGICVLGSAERGDHEDMVTTQLTFANGCVAQLTASRVSFELKREMQVFSESGFVRLDFAKGEATTVKPNEDVLLREFDQTQLSADRKAELFGGKMFEEVLVKETHSSEAVNAIELELLDFAGAIKSGIAPRVPGTAGRDAIAVAERIITAIAQHQWDGTAEGRIGQFMQVPGFAAKKAA